MEEKKIKLNLSALKVHIGGSDTPINNSIETPTATPSTESNLPVSADISVSKNESGGEDITSPSDTPAGIDDTALLLENTSVQESSLTEAKDLPKVSEIGEETKVELVINENSQSENTKDTTEEVATQTTLSDETSGTPSPIIDITNTEKNSLIDIPSEKSSEAINTASTEILPIVENTPLEKTLEATTSSPSDTSIPAEGVSQNIETGNITSEETPTKPLISLNIGVKKEDTLDSNTTTIVQEDGKQPIVEGAKNDDTHPSIIQKIKLPKINFSAMQKTHQEDEQKVADKKKVTDNEIHTEQVVKEKAPELFSNYKPSFDGRAKKFLQHLKEIRLKPRTRNSLVFGLVFCTAAFVGYLFYFHSDRHSLSIYKATLTEDIKMLTTKKPSPVTNTPEVVVDNTTPSSGAVMETGSTVTPPVQVTTKNNDTNSGSTSTQREELRKEKIKKYFSK